MQAIITKFVGPGKYKATAAYSRRSVTVSPDHSNSTETCHDLAAKALCEKMGWRGELVCGVGHKGEHIYCFITYTSTPGTKPYVMDTIDLG